MSEKFTIQIEARIVISKTIKADSFEEAAAEAARIAQNDRISNPIRGWDFEYEVEGKVITVMA